MPKRCSSHPRKVRRVYCPVCGRDIGTTVWGKLFHHNYKTTRERCPGSGKRPRIPRRVEEGA